MSNARPPVEHRVFRFSDFELEPTERRLIRRGEIVSLTPKAFELLHLLVSRAGHVLSKDDLMTALWPGRFVTESNLTKHVWMLRRALGDDRDAGGCIETVSKTGYRFVEPVTSAEGEPRSWPGPPGGAVRPGGGRRALPGSALARWRPGWPAGAAAAGVVVAALAGAYALWPPGASSAGRAATAISLLSFDNITRDARESWIGPVLTETLGTEIGLARGVRIIPGELARPVAAGLPPFGPGGYASPTLATIRRRLGADYVVSGGYLVSGEGPQAIVRLDVALQDSRDGRVFSHSRSGPMVAMPTLVTQVGADLRRDLGVGGDRIEEAGLTSGVQAPTAEVMRHLGYGLDALHRYDAARARDELLDATAEAPAYAPAYVYLAQAWSALGYQSKAAAAAERAAAYAAGLPAPLRLQIEAERQAAAFDWAGAARTLRRLVALRPGDPEPRLQLIDILTRGGKAGEAADQLAGLRELARGGAIDPRIELAATRIASARDDTKAHALHAARALAQARANQEDGLAAEAEVQWAIALTGPDSRAAGALLRRAIADYRRMGNPHGEAWAWQNLGILLSDGTPDQARAAYERALAQYQSIGDLSGTAKVFSDLAVLLWSSGDRDAAERAATHVLELRRQTDDLAGQAWALAALAVAASDESASDAVVAQFRQAIALDVAAGARAHQAFSLLSLSDILRMRGDLADAARLCAQGQAITARLGGSSDAGADFQCAQIALDRGDLTGAQAALATARRKAEAAGDAMTLGNVDLMRGQIALSLGRPAEAMGFLTQARGVCARAGLTTGEAVADGLLALSEAALNQAKGRDDDAARAAALRRRITERQEVFALDIAAAQLTGLTGGAPRALAGLDTLAADAGRRNWLSWSLEARLAALDVLRHGGETARLSALRRGLLADAQRTGFGWVARRAEMIPSG